MKVLKQYASAEIEVKKSRFLAEAFPIKSQQEARELLKQQKIKYSDATHVVHAFSAGLGGEICGCSDDGEPAGTAGRPVLDVLKGSDCTNILLTVTRWFGGTLLGTGGLVRAYGDSAKEVLAVCSMEEYISKVPFSVSTNYQLYEQVKKLLGRFEAEIENEDFAENIVLKGNLPEKNKPALQKEVENLSCGKISVV